MARRSCLENSRSLVFEVQWSPVWYSFVVHCACFLINCCKTRLLWFYHYVLNNISMGLHQCFHFFWLQLSSMKNWVYRLYPLELVFWLSEHVCQEEGRGGQFSQILPLWNFDLFSNTCHDLTNSTKLRGNRLTWKNFVLRLSCKLKCMCFFLHWNFEITRLMNNFFLFQTQ